MKYKRILLKLSGEALLGNQQYGIDPAVLEQYAKEVKSIVDAGVEVAIVIGGGNIFRGVQGAQGGVVDRATGDYMGMLATMMNAMAIQGSFEKFGMTLVCFQPLKWNKLVNLLFAAEPCVTLKKVEWLSLVQVPVILIYNRYCCFFKSCGN